MIGRHPDSTLRAIGLACTRGDSTLFAALGFELANGGLLRISGANGSGKTSLLRVICGLLPPASGTVQWNGEVLRALGDGYHQCLAYVGHLNGIKDELSVFENLSHAGRFAGLSPGEGEVSGALQEFALDRLGQLQSKFLSQGQKRRLALARLRLATSKALWVLDEPFVALDPAGIEVVRSLIAEHLSAGGLVVLTTHQEIPIDSANTQRIDL